MTAQQEALQWILATKGSAESSGFGCNQRCVRGQITENRDARGLADAFSYQVNLALHEARSTSLKTDIRLEYNNLLAVLDKRKECLEAIYQVAKMEDLFSSLTADIDSTATSLSKKYQDTAIVVNHSTPSVAALKVSQNCMQSLQDNWDWLMSLARCSQIHLQNAALYHQFWHEVEEGNRWLAYQLHKLPERFSTKWLHSGSTYEIKQIMVEMTNTLKEYLQWQTRFDILFEKAKMVIPLKLRTEKLQEPKIAQVLVSYATKEFEIKEGDVVTLVDNSDTQKWRIRIPSSSGKEVMEVTVPAIIMLIPATEATALDATLRMRLEMLAIWSAATKRLAKQITSLLLLVFRDWDAEEKSMFGTMTEAQRQNLLETISFMEQTLGRTLKGSPVYDRLLAQSNLIATFRSTEQKGDNFKVTVIFQVNYVQKLLQRYWDFWTYCDAYKNVLEEMRQPKHIFIYNDCTKMRYMTTLHYIKFLDVDLEQKNQLKEATNDEAQSDAVDGLQSAPTTDEQEEEEYFESGVKEQRTETEEVMESEMEVETTFVITGIVSNPGMEPEEIISLQDAIDRRIIDPARGLYVNRKLAISVPIPQAMNEGLIKMGPKEEKISEEKVKSAGIITVKTTRETRPYTVIQALNTRTQEMLCAADAFREGILDPDKGAFRDLQKGTMMLIGDAVDAKLVDIQYDSLTPRLKEDLLSKPAKVLEEVTKTFLVHAVVCQETQTKLPFHEAVMKGIIDKETGAYLHNISGERFFVVDAIQKGFIKATETDKPPALQLGELKNLAVEKKVGVVRSKLLNPLRALNALRAEINGNHKNGLSPPDGEIVQGMNVNLTHETTTA